MANVEKLSIALPKEMVAAIKDAVDSGDYATTSEVVRDALRSWRFGRISVDPKDARTIRRLVAEGIASGPSRDAKAVFDRLEAEYAKLAARKKSGEATKRKAGTAVAKRRVRS